MQADLFFVGEVLVWDLEALGFTPVLFILIVRVISSSFSYFFFFFSISYAIYPKLNSQQVAVIFSEMSKKDFSAIGWRPGQLMSYFRGGCWTINMLFISHILQTWI